MEKFLTEVRSGVPQVRDWTYTTRDGSELSIKVAVTARRDAAGDVDGFLFVGTDVTADREQARMKDQFVNLISHELRTPLSSILGYLELLEDDEETPLTAEQAQYVGTIERNANRLLRLVSDLLFTAQVESGRFQVQEQAVDLQPWWRHPSTARARSPPRGGVTLRMAACDEPVFVSGDPMRLGQAVDNLVSNAVKFTPSGGRVAVTLGTDGGDNARALISVSDTGVGIPADEVDRLVLPVLPRIHRQCERDTRRGTGTVDHPGDRGRAPRADPGGQHRRCGHHVHAGSPAGRGYRTRAGCRPGCRPRCRRLCAPADPAVVRYSCWHRRPPALRRRCRRLLMTSRISVDGMSGR